MHLLELFSGTSSVGNVAKSLGYNVISLELKNADINCDILEWDYKQFNRNHFNLIWASPPALNTVVLKLLVSVRLIMLIVFLKTREIIDYFKPKYWIIENPQTGLLKEQPFMSGLKYYDVDYCKYGMNYRKRTRLWTNIETWKPRPLCNRDCGKVRNWKHVETAQRLPSGKRDSWGDGYIKHKQEDLYKIPVELISEIFVCLIDVKDSGFLSKQRL